MVSSSPQTVSPTPVSAGAIYAPIAEDLKLVEESLRQIVPPEAIHLADSIAHSMQAKGKLLRPLLTLLVAGATGGEIRTPHIETAAVAELIHVATLLHDDVLDESDTRRGRPTVRSQWGNKVSILSGDYLLAQASLKLSKLDNCRLVSIYATVLSNLCEGEVEQMRSSYNMQTTWGSYFRKSICKTASLFSACCESAGVINQLPESQIQSLKQYGENLGIVFQIADDMLDFTATAEQLGKPVLDDLKNGILNAPILLALEHFKESPEPLKELTGIIDQLFQLDTEENLPIETSDRFYALLEEARAIEKTSELAERYRAEACQSIAFIPDNIYRKALTDLTQYALQRKH